PNGHALLTKLNDRLPHSEQEPREDGFAQAHDFIDVASTSGGITGKFKKSFPNRPLRRTDTRVDIEVHAGQAFVAA
ncbi:MAG: hypothetical protein ACHP8A_17395, partial [Terriglobales bacterium]